MNIGFSIGGIITVLVLLYLGMKFGNRLFGMVGLA